MTRKEGGEGGGDSLPSASAGRSRCRFRCRFGFTAVWGEILLELCCFQASHCNHSTQSRPAGAESGFHRAPRSTRRRRRPRSLLDECFLLRRVWMNKSLAVAESAPVSVTTCRSGFISIVFCNILFWCIVA